MIKIILIIENDAEQCFLINEMPISEVAEGKLNLNNSLSAVLTICLED